MAAKYPGQVNFVSENFGASKLAEQFGVKGYPAVFVDGVLVAAPREFGYFGDADGTGRYAPWRNAENQAKFKTDLTHMIDLILAGHKDIVKKEQSISADAFREIDALPPFRISDLNGKSLDAASLSGRPVLVEFWATWCVPCRSTLAWLGELKKKYGDNLAIVTFAVESPEAAVRSTAEGFNQDLHWAIADAPSARLFGDITAVPTMFLFDKSGKTAKVFYGAPPDLHEEAGRLIERLVK